MLFIKFISTTHGLEFFNIYYRRLITLNMLEQETEVIGNTVLVKGINLMMAKPFFPFFI